MNTCDAWLRPVTDFGEVQADAAAPSRLHANVEPPTVELKPNDANVLSSHFDGLAVIVVSGAEPAGVAGDRQRRVGPSWYR